MKKTFIFLFFISNAFGIDQQYLEKMQKLSQLDPSFYALEIDDLALDLDRYIEKKTFFCEREISLEEKKKCGVKVRELKLEYFKNIFLARKNYIEYLHKQRLDDLELERESLLKTLN